jgi:hypothetical protein
MTVAKNTRVAVRGWLIRTIVLTFGAVGFGRRREPGFKLVVLYYLHRCTNPTWSDTAQPLTRCWLFIRINILHLYLIIFMARKERWRWPTIAHWQWVRYIQYDLWLQVFKIRNMLVFSLKLIHEKIWNLHVYLWIALLKLFSCGDSSVVGW